MNLGTRCGDRPVLVAENRRRLRADLPGEPAWLTQVHGERVVAFEEVMGLETEADGIVSGRPGQICAVLTADCLPVLFCDRSGNRVAAAHAGWRGLAAGILQATVDKLGVDPGDVLAWLGPGIGPSVYEVGAEVREAFIGANREARYAFAGRGGRWLADLYLLARQTLARAGVGQIHGGGFCTYTEKDRFFSHRRDGQTGRMATVIWKE